MEYTIEFRVFRSDDGFRYSLEMKATEPKLHLTTLVSRAYKTEAMATTAGLLRMPKFVGDTRRQVQL